MCVYIYIYIVIYIYTYINKQMCMYAYICIYIYIYISINRSHGRLIVELLALLAAALYALRWLIIVCYSIIMLYNDISLIYYDMLCYIMIHYIILYYVTL